MHIALNIPDNIAGVIAPGPDAASATLEAFAVEGYRSDRLSEYDIQQLMGFESRFDVHGSLTEP